MWFHIPRNERECHPLRRSRDKLWDVNTSHSYPLCNAVETWAILVDSFIWELGKSLERANYEWNFFTAYKECTWFVSVSRVHYISKILFLVDAIPGHSSIKSSTHLFFQVDSFSRILSDGSRLWAEEDVAAIVEEYGIVVITRWEAGTDFMILEKYPKSSGFVLHWLVE